MPRRIYIIPKSMKVKDAVDAAKAANCPEIVHGIPPALAGIVAEADLPTAFEEPQSPQAPEARILETEIDDLKARLEKLEKKAESKQENDPLGFLKGIFKG